MYKVIDAFKDTDMRVVIRRDQSSYHCKCLGVAETVGLLKNTAARSQP